MTWAANWYMTRRHIVDGESLHALCSQFTTVYPDGWQSGATSHRIPPGDSPEVMELKPCGLCTRKAKT